MTPSNLRIRTILFFWLMISTLQPNIHAQLSVASYIDITSRQAIIPRPTRMSGVGIFSLDDGYLWSFAHIEFGHKIDTCEIFRSTSPAVLGERLFDLELGGYYQDPDTESAATYAVFHDKRPLTPSLRADFDAGNLWINVTSEFYPGESIRAQIVPVPEPPPKTLIAVAVITLLACTRFH